MRIDRLLWFLRFARSRSAAQALIDRGHMRRNSKRVTGRDEAVKPGDILVLPLGRRVIAVEILAMPTRRGPASEAQSCYRVLDPAPNFAIAHKEKEPSEGESRP